MSPRLAKALRTSAYRARGLREGSGNARLGGSLDTWYFVDMRTYTAVVEKDAHTGLYVGYVPGWPGAHSQGDTEDELRRNLEEVIAMLLEDGEPSLQAEFVGTQTVRVA